MSSGSLEAVRPSPAGGKASAGGVLPRIEAKHLFLAPALVYLLAVIIFPFLFTIGLSFSGWNVTRPTLKMNGLENYANLLRDSRFWHSFLVLVLVVAAAFLLEYWIGLGLALLLAQKRKGDRFFRVIFLIPMMVTPSIIAAVFRTMFHETLGPINDILHRLGLGGLPWLSHNALALVSIILVDVWQWTSFMLLILLGGLLQLPHEPYEAAALDGASKWQTFRHITLPLLGPVTAAATLIRVIELSKIMETIYVLTSGGPGTATETTSYYILIRGFREFRLGYASALSLVYLVLMTIALTILARYLTRDGHREEVSM